MGYRWKQKNITPKRLTMSSSTAEESAQGCARPQRWHSRGYLPHFEGGEIAQTVTFRLFDSIPQVLISQWRAELAASAGKSSEMKLRKRVEDYLDRGEGKAWLRDPQIADKVQDALLFFDGERYRLQAWVVMPNHVHALLTPTNDWELGSILHSWKSFTASECNKLLGLRGNFWQEDFFDRYVRDEKHYNNAITYVHDNPVKAGLCKRPEDWPWSSAGNARILAR